MYAANKSNFEEGSNKIVTKKKKHPAFVKKFEGLYKRASEWALYERSEMLTRDNHTNNYSEVFF